MNDENNYGNAIGQEQMMEHNLKILNDVFARHNNSRGDYYKRMLQYFYIITTLAVATEVVSLHRPPSAIVKIALWTDDDQANYAFDNICDETAKDYAERLWKVNLNGHIPLDILEINTNPSDELQQRIHIRNKAKVDKRSYDGDNNYENDDFIMAISKTIEEHPILQPILQRHLAKPADGNVNKKRRLSRTATANTNTNSKKKSTNNSKNQTKKKSNTLKIQCN